MTYAEFLVSAVVISLSGVMAPGPLTAITIGKGSESPHAGGLVGIGHGIIEFPLMFFIFIGFGKFFNRHYVQEAIGFIGGLFLLFMAAGMVKNIFRKGGQPDSDMRSPLAVGMIFSAGNPYFLVWWATVGAALIMNAGMYGTAALVIFMFIHWLCDFFWFYALSFFSYRGAKFF